MVWSSRIFLSSAEGTALSHHARLLGDLLQEETWRGSCQSAGASAGGTKMQKSTSSNQHVPRGVRKARGSLQEPCAEEAVLGLAGMGRLC